MVSQLCHYFFNFPKRAFSKHFLKFEKKIQVFLVLAPQSITSVPQGSPLCPTILASHNSVS